MSELTTMTTLALCIKRNAYKKELHMSKDDINREDEEYRSYLNMRIEHLQSEIDSRGANGCL